VRSVACNSGNKPRPELQDRDTGPEATRPRVAQLSGVSKAHRRLRLRRNSRTRPIWSSAHGDSTITEAVEHCRLHTRLVIVSHNLDGEQCQAELVVDLAVNENTSSSTTEEIRSRRFASLTAVS